jgi:NADPH:quinone reductase-like Zn-dependent oxidoreductase
MRAAFIRKYGKNEVVELGELPRPPITSRDVLIKIHAASVNPVDFKLREGGLRLLRSPPMPIILGNDLSGVVAEVGSEVTTFVPGDEVFARVDKDRIGTFCDYAAVQARHVARKPKNLSHVEAAAIPLVGLTAWQALTDFGSLGAGQKVLIHAASGGVGTLAIQLAKHLGVTVAVTAGGRNRQLCEGLGADLFVDYKTQRFEELLTRYDLVLDTLGGETRLRSLPVLRPGGVLVTIAGAPTAKVGKELGVNALLRLAFDFMNREPLRRARELGVRYEYLFMRPDGEQLAMLAALCERGVLRPILDRVFPFTEVKEALAYSEAGHAVGKVVIDLSQAARPGEK